MSYGLEYLERHVTLDKQANGLGHSSSSDIAEFQKFYCGKTVCEIGFGDGQFMRSAAPHSHEFRGIELNSSSLIEARKDSIVVEDNLSKFSENYSETIILFHTFEHLSDPLNKLRQIMRHLKKEDR